MRTIPATFASLLLLLDPTPACAEPLGTAFTYQGQLKESGQPASGLYDFQVCLFDTLTQSILPWPICPPGFESVPVDAGLFSLTLDFGAAPFTGEARYLELRVRPSGGAGAYTVLAPRQPIRPVPEALRASSIADGEIGLVQIDSTQVQARVAGACALGTYLRGINADGSVLCSDLPGVNSLTTVDEPANVVGLYTSIAIGSDGLPVISYLDSTAGALKVARCANAACTGSATITTVDDPANFVGLYTSIAIGSDGRPVISYSDLSADALKVAKCANTACTGFATITTVDDSANIVGEYSSIAIGNDGLPVISYYDFTAKALRVAKCANAACTGSSTITTVDDPVNQVGQYTSIAIGNDGLPVISYYDTSASALKVAKCANAACTGSATITTVENQASVGTHNSIAIGSDGLPVISYHDDTADALRVAKCANAACTGSATINIVDDQANTVGTFTSIAIGNDGLPVISYHDASASALKVAKCANEACTGNVTIATVDDPAIIVGRYTSIAIGNDGLPVISYSDVGNNTLKVMKCGTRSCQ